MYNSISGSGPQLTDDTIARVEDEMRRKIPLPFRSFLLTHNGGRPDGGDFIAAESPAGTSPEGTIKSFLGVGMPERTFNLDYVLSTFAGRIPDWCFPVARDPGGNLVLLAETGPDAGKVYFWDHELEAEEGQPPTNANLYFIADSFGDFLESLT